MLSTTFEELRAGMAKRGVEKVIPVLSQGARLAGKFSRVFILLACRSLQSAKAMDVKNSKETMLRAGEFLNRVIR